ncbi:MAG: imidazole glycerol phosphate synthase subunit HisH, partial [Gemmatimonadetes bacterium]|nr:imidazole glycerol phosphate synthase subunit HisH [Gemmatimonadota bacterium]
MSAVRIVATGVANLASVRAAFARLGLATEVVQDAAAIASAHRLVLPGVGAFAAGMQRLRELELVEALRE